MTHTDVLAQLKKLSATERLRVAEEALQLVRQELELAQPAEARSGQRQRLAAAAAALREDYSAGGELTAFTALDGEDVRASG
jgi:ABC-type thiamine transport system ATPase subunit